MNEYEDIINLPHYKSSTHIPMSNYKRAAQFAPFAALNGFEASINETARYTNDRIELSDDRINKLNLNMQLVFERLSERPSIEITYFVPDSKKTGGEYLTVTGNLRHIDIGNRKLIFSDDMVIGIDDIFDIRLIQ